LDYEWAKGESMIKKIILIMICLLGARVLRADELVQLRAENAQLRDEVSKLKSERVFDRSASIGIAATAMVVGVVAVWYYERQLPDLETKISKNRIIKLITTHEGSGQEMVDRLVAECCHDGELGKLIAEVDQSIELLEQYLQWKTPKRFDRFAWA
jgi:hypothetical protein